MKDGKKDGTVDAVCAVLAGGLILCSFMFILPPIFLFGGLIAGLMTGNKKFIATTTRFIQGLLMIALVGFSIAAVINWDPDYYQNVFLVGSLLCGVAAVLLQFLWLNPLNRQFDNLYAAIIRKRAKAPEKDPLPIMSKELSTTYSVADELIKWKTLKEEGVIDEAEFAKIRDKLMQKE